MIAFFCAQDWIRTSTSFRTLPPEDSASTNFATWASFDIKISNDRAANIATPKILHFSPKIFFNLVFYLKTNPCLNQF